MPDVGGVAGQQLKSFIDRIDWLEEEKRALSGDIKEVFRCSKVADTIRPNTSLEFRCEGNP